MSSSMKKALAMDKELELTEEKLAEFIEKYEPKFAADIEKEEQRVESGVENKANGNGTPI